MRKKHLLVILGLLLSTFVDAQIRLAEMQNFHTGLTSSYTLPSKLGYGYKRVQLELGSPYAGVANSAFSLDAFQHAKTFEKMSVLSFDKAVSRLGNNNSFYAGVESQIVNLGLTFKKFSYRTPVYIGVGIRERAEASLLYSSDLLKLIYNGNKQFAGESISLSTNFNALQYTDYSVMAAYPFQWKLKDSSVLHIKPALRFRYLRSGFNIHTQSANNTMYTDANGKYVDLGFDYLVQTALVTDTPDVTKKLPLEYNLNQLLAKPAGHGFAIDLGATAYLSENMVFNIGLIDIGKINYKNNTIQYSSDKTYRFDGYPAYGYENSTNPSSSLDSLEAFSSPDKSYDPYTVALPTKLIMSFEYKIGHFLFKRMHTFRHNLSVIYVQGFRNYLSSTTKPVLDIGYVYSMQNKINAGLHMMIGGHSRFGIGPQVTLKLGAFRLGFLSNNMLGIIYPSKARGIDVSMNAGVTF